MAAAQNSRSWGWVVAAVGALLLGAVFLVGPLTLGLPLTLLGVIAVVVVLAWVGGSVGPARIRHVVGAVWLAFLVAAWAFAVWPFTFTGPADPFALLALVLSGLSLLLPTVWRRVWASRARSLGRAE
jgi:hypothetical protein